MIKELLKEQQPVVYTTLKHALELDKLAHAYMSVSYTHLTLPTT